MAIVLLRDPLLKKTVALCIAIDGDSPSPPPRSFPYDPCLYFSIIDDPAHQSTEHHQEIQVGLYVDDFVLLLASDAKEQSLQYM